MKKKIAFIIFLVVYLTAPLTFGSFPSDSKHGEYYAVMEEEPITLEDYRDMVDYVKKNGQQEPIYQGTRYFVRLDAPDHMMPEFDHPFKIAVEFSFITGPAGGINITAFGKHLVKGTYASTYLYSHLYMDDADMDMRPNSIVQVMVTTEDAVIVHEQYRSISKNHTDWHYYLHFVYDKFKEGGM